MNIPLVPLIPILTVAALVVETTIVEYKKLPLEHIEIESFQQIVFSSPWSIASATGNSQANNAALE
jgi:hypothetical protein